MSSVPDTTTFTLADVVAAVLPSSNDLIECFDDAVDGAFDSSYGPGDESNLLQFRNYGNNTAAQNPVYIAVSQASSGLAAACSASRTVLVYKNRNPNSVENGDLFWEEDPFNPGNPGNLFNGNIRDAYSAFTGLNSSSFKISGGRGAKGVVSDVQTCGTSLTLTDVFYSIAGGFSTPVDYYYNSTIGNASNLGSGDIIYSDSSLTTPLSATQTGMQGTTYNQSGSAATTTRCTLNKNFGFTISANTGAISSASCGEQYWDYTAGTQSTPTNICSLSLTEIIYQQHPTLQAFDFNDPIYSDISGTLAPAGWWKVSVLYRYWTGSAWTGTTALCP